MIAIRDADNLTKKTRSHLRDESIDFLTPLTGGSVWRELEGPLLLPIGLLQERFSTWVPLPATRTAAIEFSSFKQMVLDLPSDSAR